MADTLRAVDTPSRTVSALDVLTYAFVSCARNGEASAANNIVDCAIKCGFGYLTLAQSVAKHFIDSTAEDVRPAPPGY